jgi:hypothetical protein
LVEVLTEPSIDGDNTRAFTNVVAWATEESDYRATLASVFDGYGWTVLGVENLKPIDEATDFSEEISEIVERARTFPKACIFGTFYYYPSRPA